MAEVVHGGAGPHFAGVDAEDAGGIGEGAFQGDAAFRLLQVDEFAVAADVFAFRFDGAHGVGREVVFEKQFPLQVRHISFFIEIVHFLAELSDGVALVVGLVVFIDQGQHFLHGRVFVDEGFKAHQRIHQTFHFLFRLCRRQEEKDIVQITFLRDQAIFPHEFRHDGAGDAEVFIVTGNDVDARSDEHEFHGIQEILAATVSVEAVPGGAGLEGPVAAVGGDLVRVAIFPFLGADVVGNEGADVVTTGEDVFADADAEEQGVAPQFLSRFAFVDFRVDIQRREELVERRRGGVHHERVVHALVGHVAVLAADVGVFLVNLGGHGETGLLLVHRLGDEDARIIGTQVQEQRAGVIHHGDKFFVAHPGGVEENIIAQVADAFHDLPRVADAAVVSAQLDDGETDGAVFLRFLRISFSDEGADVVLF